MGRHTKLKPPAKPPADTDRAPLDLGGLPDRVPRSFETLGGDAETLLRRTYVHLTKLQSAVEETLAAGDASPALARESASVARAITALAAECRAWEKHERLAAEALTPDEIDDLTVGMILDTPLDRQEAILARLQAGAKERRGVLA